MRSTAMLLLIGLFAAPVNAQERGGRYGDRSQGIPPGQLPPPGQCRLWYDDRPPGRQPPPTNCREAERIAERDGNARVIYGTDGASDSRWYRNDDRRDLPWSVPGDSVRDPYSGRRPYGDEQYPYANRRSYSGGTYGYERVAFDNGYKDGYEQGRNDGRHNNRYDPFRQGRYRSADHGYDRSYGSKGRYNDMYRDGFQAGYREGYRDVR